MSPYTASVLIDLGIWLFIIWVAVIAFGARLAVLHRRRLRAVRIATRPKSPTAEPRTVTVVPPQRRAS